MIKIEELNRILLRLQTSSTDFEGCAVVSSDGLMIASLLPREQEENLSAAMSAAMIGMGVKTASELNRGNLKQVMVDGEKGYVIITQAGANTLLLCFVRQGARLGLVFLGTSRAAEEISNVLAVKKNGTEKEEIEN